MDRVWVELAGGGKGTMTEIDDAHAEVQCDPIVTDARHEPSELCFSYYANYPAAGSAFSECGLLSSLKHKTKYCR